jgi:hypothetical protein
LRKDREAILGLCNISHAPTCRVPFVKSISIMGRRSGMTRKDFIDHYENVHAPMGYTYYHFVKYIRNYVDQILFGEFAFDVIAEFYPDGSRPHADLPESVLQAFADDRALFMDSVRTGGLVDEIVASGDPRTVDPIGLRKICILTKGRAGAIVDDLIGGAGRRDLARITVDSFQQPVPDRPFDALIWLWADALADDDLNRLGARPDVTAILSARSFETPTELLRVAK